MQLLIVAVFAATVAVIAASEGAVKEDDDHDIERIDLADVQEAPAETNFEDPPTDDEHSGFIHSDDEHSGFTDDESLGFIDSDEESMARKVSRSGDHFGLKRLFHSADDLEKEPSDDGSLSESVEDSEDEQSWEWDFK